MRKLETKDISFGPKRWSALNEKYSKFDYYKNSLDDHKGCKLQP